MSTLEVSCARCDKKFRVRAEFAGRSTRCPGCSAPITIGGAPSSAAPKKPIEEQKTRLPSRSRDDDGEPPRPALDWRPAVAAFQREQVAVIFGLLSILGGFFIYCAGNSMRSGGDFEGIMVFLMLLFGVGPSLGAVAFGIMARIAALGTPKESLARGTAAASLICSLVAGLSLLALGLTWLISIDSTNRRDPFAFVVAPAGVLVSALASVLTFFGYVAQVGMIRRSAAVSRAVGRMAIGMAVCTAVIVGISLLYAFFDAVTEPSYGRRSRHNDHEAFAGFTLGILIPLALAVVLIFYHRLLAAGRLTTSGDTTSRQLD